MRIHEDRTRPAPERACAACRTRRPAAELLRFARRGASAVPDPRRRLPGRGLNLCPSRDCLRRAVKRGAFRRGLGVGADADTLEVALQDALREALADALRGARRPSHLTEVGRLDEVRPSSLRPLVEAGEAAAVCVRSARLERRVAALAAAICEFTFKGPGVMKRPPKGTGAPRQDDGARSSGLDEAAETTNQTAPNSESA